jgi:hypothetical protein
VNQWEIPYFEFLGYVKPHLDDQECEFIIATRLRKADVDIVRSFVVTKVFVDTASTVAQR